MIGYVFATPHEGSGLVKQLQGTDRFEIGPLQCITGKLNHRQVVVAFLGMGLERAGEQARLLLSYFRLRGLILSGYGGGLVSQLKKGQVVIANNYTTDEVQHF